jgi:hypothetical protein
MHVETQTLRFACGCYQELRLAATGPLTAPDLDLIASRHREKLCVRCDRRCRRLVEGRR